MRIVGLSTFNCMANTFLIYHLRHLKTWSTRGEDKDSKAVNVKVTKMGKSFKDSLSVVLEIQKELTSGPETTKVQYSTIATAILILISVVNYILQIIIFQLLKRKTFLSCKTNPFCSSFHKEFIQNRCVRH